MNTINTHCVIKVPVVTKGTVRRVRIQANADDYRSIVWPVKHPYWCSGYGNNSGGEYAVIVAYVEEEADIKRQWPEAADIQIMESDEEFYTFTSRFQPPDWFLPDIGARGIPPLVHDDIELMTQRWEAVVSILGGMRGIELVYHPEGQRL